jgi:hypothetical protein
VSSASASKLAKAIGDLGFVESEAKRLFAHSETPWLVEFPAGSLGFGGQIVDASRLKAFDTHFGPLRVITPTLCVMAPFTAVMQCARDPVNSGFCQGVGTEMREAGIEAFEYHSARSGEAVVQVGVSSCCLFIGTPFDRVEVQLEANRHDVMFRCLDDNTVHYVQRHQFEGNGELARSLH